MVLLCVVTVPSGVTVRGQQSTLVAAEAARRLRGDQTTCPGQIHLARGKVSAELARAP